VATQDLVAEATGERLAPLVVAEQGVELVAQARGVGPDREVWAEQLPHPGLAVGDRQRPRRQRVEDAAVDGAVGEGRAGGVVEDELGRRVDRRQVFVGGGAAPVPG
jgi:hypothetical protein